MRVSLSKSRRKKHRWYEEERSQQNVYVHGEISLNQYDGCDGFAASTTFNIVCPNVLCGAINKVTGCGDK